MPRAATLPDSFRLLLMPDRQSDSPRRLSKMHPARLLTPNGVLIAGALLLMFFWTLSALVLYQSRSDAYQRAEGNARNLVLVLERDIARSIEQYDLSLQAVVDGMRQPQVMALPPHLRNLVLFDRATTGRYLGTIYVVDAHGNIVLDSRADTPPAGNFAMREDIAIHREQPDLGLYISRPLPSPMHRGMPMLTLTRRIDNEDGSFGGVVVGALSIDYFRSLLDGLSVGPHGSASVIGTSGALITRLPFDSGMVGRDVSNTTVYRDAMTRPTGSVAGFAKLDGTRRLYVFRRLPTLPIIVNVAPAEDDIYMEWRHRAGRLGVIVAVFSFVVSAGAVLLSHELRLRQKAELQLHRLVRTDALTGLGNRRAFDATLHGEWLRAQRTGKPLSLLFVDIDQFKAYNDRYGHPAGDDVLREVGRMLTQCVRRPSDSVARYGGEEFVVTLPDTDAAGATYIGEHVRSSIYELAIPHTTSRHGRVTVSIGIVTSGDTSVASDAAFVSLADTALYHAKTAGRNRICDPQGVVLA